MRSEKLITIHCQTILGVIPDLNPTNKLLLAGLDSMYKGSVVARTFEVWAREHKYDEIRKPVATFLKVASDLLGAEISTREATLENPVVKKAGREIAYITDNQVTLGVKHKSSLALVVAEEDYTYEEVMTAFRDFFQKVNVGNTRDLGFVAKNFVESASDLFHSVRRKSQERLQEAAAVERKAQSLTEEAEVARRAREVARIKAEEEAEEGLPD